MAESSSCPKTTLRKGIPSGFSHLYDDFTTPNYMTLNAGDNVTVPDGEDEYEFLYRGVEGVACKQLPWYLEGVSALMVGDTRRVLRAIPNSPARSNRAGSCQIAFSVVGEALSVQRLRRLNSPLWLAEDYATVRAFFNAAAAMGDRAVVLGRGSGE